MIICMQKTIENIMKFILKFLAASYSQINRADEIL